MKSLFFFTFCFQNLPHVFLNDILPRWHGEMSRITVWYWTTPQSREMKWDALSHSTRAGVIKCESLIKSIQAKSSQVPEWRCHCTRTAPHDQANQVKQVLPSFDHKKSSSHTRARGKRCRMMKKKSTGSTGTRRYQSLTAIVSHSGVEVAPTRSVTQSLSHSVTQSLSRTSALPQLKNYHLNCERSESIVQLKASSTIIICLINYCLLCLPYLFLSPLCLIFLVQQQANKPRIAF